MRHANLTAQVVDQGLQVVFEEILMGRIAAAAIAQQQDGCGLGIATLADAFQYQRKLSQANWLVS